MPALILWSFLLSESLRHVVKANTE